MNEHSSLYKRHRFPPETIQFFKRLLRASDTALDSLKPRLKETQHLRLVNELKSADFLSSFSHINSGLCCDIHMRLCVDTTRNGEPNEFETGFVILASHCIPARGNNTSLHRAHS